MSDEPSTPPDKVGLRMRPAVLATFVALLTVAYGAGFYTARRAPPRLSQQPLDVRCLIESVKAELVAAERAQRQRNEAALFELKDFDMEINYVVRNSGGLKAEVVGVGTNLDAGSERIQKLHLRWAAIGTREEPIPPTLSIDEPNETQGATAQVSPQVGQDTSGCQNPKEAR